jgi:hypothetical protein
MRLGCCQVITDGRQGRCVVAKVWPSLLSDNPMERVLGSGCLLEDACSLSSIARTGFRVGILGVRDLRREEGRAAAGQIYGIDISTSCAAQVIAFKLSDPLDLNAMCFFSFTTLLLSTPC